MRTKIYKSSAVIFILLINLLISSSVFAQAYEKMSYQAVIRDANNNLVTNQTIGIQVSIMVGAGTAYIETHTPTTNANGLISIEVGGGTLVAGGWSSIYWAYGECYIKTEVDPTGGTNYTITSTNQLLSVPYAKIAEVADTVLNTVTYTSGPGIDITNYVVSNTAISTTYEVGDYAQGGVVFWLDETGQHGLVCAIEDLSDNWYNGTYTNTEAHSDGVYAGEMNSLLIIANQGSVLTNYAAGKCVAYSVTFNGISYGDWYLPSKYELDLMYQNKTTIDATATANGGDNFASESYWSSLEDDLDNAWCQYFGSGTQNILSKIASFRVRAIRAF